MSEYQIILDIPFVCVIQVEMYLMEKCNLTAMFIVWLHCGWILKLNFALIINKNRKRILTIIAEFEKMMRQFKKVGKK